MELNEVDRVDVGDDVDIAEEAEVDGAGSDAVRDEMEGAGKDE